MIASKIILLKQCWSLATPFAQNSKLIKSYTNLYTCNLQSIRCWCSQGPIKYKQLEQRPQNGRRQPQASKRFELLNNNLSLFRRKGPSKKSKRIPKLILLQNPFTWLMTKIDFIVLRRVWDSTFREKDFKFGATQAISRITHLISEGQLGELNGLLTKPARLSLLRDLDRNWGEKQRALLALNHKDIQISSPRKVYFIRIADKKFCDVDMAFLALKWAPINNIDALIFTEIFARFHREYTPNSIPEWTIAFFKVTRFEVLRR
ncbi:m-AAA protease-interacting protein 1, mitochondrial [Pieris napi]|uniref:m-AAA protease-interacting protein 1, mitochondrial n=1 Tax=Pieris napi TaxID=78633 RepID=UPI001FB8CEE0|nr:m-AAA protease-interacting protein 1, mitochondrial [Pieris napi]